jgi:hypothetical protein
MEKPFPSAPTRIGAAVASTLAPVQSGDVMAPKSDAELQQLTDSLKPTAPRLTPELIQSVIVDETYTRLEGTNTTVCRLQLANGFCVVGVNNGPVSAANFSQELGCEYAYKAAVDQVWPLEGYLLAQRLHELASAPEGTTHVANRVYVTARKIQTVSGATAMGDELPVNHARLILENGEDATIDATMTSRYWPTAGDYYVVQSDGYAYINPADVFERKYASLAGVERKPAGGNLFRKKPVTVEAITFEQLVQHGRDNGGNIVDGMPWSFEYKGHPITHENDQCYLIPTKEGTMRFTPDDMLITGVQGEIYPCKRDIFAATYDRA